MKECATMCGGGKRSTPSTIVEIEIFAQTVRVCIDVLAPAIEKLVDIVKVVLASTAIGMPSGSSVFKGQTTSPAIVTSDSKRKIATVIVQKALEKLGTSPDVEFGIPAVSTWSSATLVLGNLHETLLSASANSGWVTRTLLQGKSGDQDVRNPVLVRILGEHPVEFVACLEGTTFVLQCLGQWNIDDIVNTNIRWIPSTIVDSTVQPIETSIWPRCSSRFLRSTDIPAVGLDMDNAFGATGSSRV